MQNNGRNPLLHLYFCFLLFRSMVSDPMNLQIFILGVMLFFMLGCQKEEAPAPAPREAPTSLGELGLSSALMVLRGNRVDEAEVMRAYMSLKSIETPVVESASVQVGGAFEVSKSGMVVERYPKSKLIVTLENGVITDVREITDFSVEL